MPPHVNLKQRLAALSLAPSSPSAPRADGESRSPITRAIRKTFLKPWNKRQHGPIEPGNEELDMLDKLHDVMGRLVFQAGVDFETRPMVVLNASALPDPREVSYDLLLSRIVSYFDLFVESDYTVVFFATGGRHTPGWNWIWKANRSLSRKYRKNLKRLYIVHSSFFSKMLFSLAGAIVSPKFFLKIVYADTLSELACYVPLTQIDIPPAVYQENLKHEKEITLPIQTHSDIFGVPLEDIMGYDGEKGGIPRVVRDCIQYLRESGLEEEGLFRRSPSSIMLKQAQEAYDRGQVLSLATFDDPHLAAVLIKKYLRDLPEPLFPESLYSLIRRCPTPLTDPTDISAVTYVRETILTELAPCSYILLSHILHLMHDVSLRSTTNLMDAHNLALVLVPNLISGDQALRDMSMCMIPGGPVHHASMQTTPMEGRTTLAAVIKICIQRYYEIFDEVRDRTEALPPPRSSAAEGSPSSEASSGSGSATRHAHGGHLDDDEDIDDAMLVMPIGPTISAHPSYSPSQVPPPNSWSLGVAADGTTTYRPRVREQLGGVPGTRSVYSAFGESVHRNGNGNQLMSKSKSTISIEKGRGVGTSGRKGQITVGRGTMRKTGGAGVEAIGITAAGFFAAPNSAPPVPSPRRY